MSDNSHPGVGTDSADSTGHVQVSIPPTLATHFRVIRELPTEATEATVLLVTDRTGSEERVLKLYRPGIELSDLLAAGEVLAISRDPKGRSHVVVTYEIDLDSESDLWFEIQEHCAHGSLRSVLKHSPIDAPDLASQLIAALAYLEGQGIRHRDLNPESLLVRSLDPLDVVVADLGLFRDPGFGGTIAYQPPEAAINRITPAWDWWSAGVILAEVALGKHPLAGPDGRLPPPAQTLDLLNEHSLDLTAIDDARLRSLCQGLLHRNPDHRWTAGQATTWLKGSVPIQVSGPKPSGAEARFDADLDLWVVEGGAAGPGGLTTWEAAGVRWMADRVEPGRMVRCDIDAAALDGPDRPRTLGLVELLLGRGVRDLIESGRPAGWEERAGTAEAGGERLPVDAELGSLGARQAGWLAIALDELADPDSPSLVAADALLLARRLGIDDLFPEIDLDEVAELLDGLDPGFLDRLRAEDESLFNRLLRAYAAILHTAGIPVGPRIAPSEPTPLADEAVDSLAHDLLERAGVGQSTVGDLQPDFMGPAAPTHVWCQGLPPGAVTGASVALAYGGRVANVEASVGDHPPEQLHVQALRAREEIYELVDHARLQPGAEAGILVAELRWLGSGADTLRLVTRPDGAPPTRLLASDEALHWAAEATRLARRPDQALPAVPGSVDLTERRAAAVGSMWSLSARFWRAVGADELAQAAEARISEGVPPSPFLRDQPTVATIAASATTAQPTTGPADPDATPTAYLCPTPALADTSSLLGMPAVAAATRLAAARQLLANGPPEMAAAAATLAQREYRLIGDQTGIDQAASVRAGTEHVDGES